MNSATKPAIIAHFAAAGLRIRVRVLKSCGALRYRICPVGRAEFPRDKVAQLATELGLVGAGCRPIDRHHFNTERELVAYDRNSPLFRYLNR